MNRQPTRHTDRSLLDIGTALTIAFLTSASAIGTATAFLFAFRAAIVWPLVLGVAALLAVAALATGRGRGWSRRIPVETERCGKPSTNGGTWIRRAWSAAVGVTGVGLSAIALIPIIAFPLVRVNDGWFWDASMYHLPKAIEVSRSGHFWDLEVAFAQFPYGYEATTAFVLTAGGAIGDLGWMHAVWVLAVMLAAAALIRRVTYAPAGIAWVGVVALVLVATIYEPLMRVAKNDVAVTLCVLAAAAYVPSTPARLRDGFGWQIVLMALVIGVACKPNAAVYVAIILVGGVGWALGRSVWRTGWQASGRRVAPTFRGTLVGIVYLVLLVLAALWLVRNLVVMGVPLSSFAAEIATLRIVDNLDDTALFHGAHARIVMGWLSAVLIVGVIAAWARRRRLGGVRWCWVVLLGVLIVANAFAPASFYDGAVQTRQMGGHFALGLAVMVAAMTAPIARMGVESRSRGIVWFAAAALFMAPAPVTIVLASLIVGLAWLGTRGGDGRWRVVACAWGVAMVGIAVADLFVIAPWVAMVRIAIAAAALIATVPRRPGRRDLTLLAGALAFNLIAWINLPLTLTAAALAVVIAFAPGPASSAARHRVERRQRPAMRARFAVGAPALALLVTVPLANTPQLLETAERPPVGWLDGSATHRYVHDHVAGATVLVLGDHSFYAYGADLSNTVTRGASPLGATRRVPPHDVLNVDYILIQAHRDPVYNGGAFVDLASSRFHSQWRLVVQDEDGQVQLYARRKPGGPPDLALWPSPEARRRYARFHRDGEPLPLPPGRDVRTGETWRDAGR